MTKYDTTGPDGQPRKKSPLGQSCRGILLQGIRENGEARLVCLRFWESLNFWPDRETYGKGDPHASPPTRLQAEGAAGDAPLVSTPISEQTVQVYPATVKIIRPRQGPPPTPPARQGTELQGFSSKSRQRLKFTAANSADLLRSQFCCTYHNVWPVNGRVFKAHLHSFLVAARRAFPFLAYLWVAEFQTRGAPHAHVFLNVTPTQENRDTLAHIWSRIVDPEDQELLAFHRHPRNMIAWDMGNGGYLCKYLDKEAQKSIPDGFRSFGRWWGNSRDLVPAPDVMTDTEIREELGQDRGGPRDPFAYLVRTVGRHHEKINRRSWFRHSPRSVSSMTGAKVFRQAFEYLRRSAGIEDNRPPF